MPKHTAPLFSLKATGSIANQITFQRRPRLNRSISIPSHVDASSTDQLRHRLLFLAGRDEWHWLTPAQRASYESSARPYHITGYNYFLRRFLQKQEQQYTRLLLPMHEGTGATCFDHSGYNKDGTIVGASWIMLPNGLHVLSFDGLDDNVNITNDPLFDFTTQDFTLEICLYALAITTSHRLFTRGLWKVDGYYFVVDAAGRPTFGTNQLGAVQNTYASNGDILTDRWYYLALTRSGNSATIFRNALDITAAPGVHVDPTSNTRDLEVSTSTWGRAWNGYLCQPRIALRTLTQPELQDRFNHLALLFPF